MIEDKIIQILIIIAIKYLTENGKHIKYAS